MLMYLVFVKQVLKVQGRVFCVGFRESKIGLNVNIFHVIGPTPSGERAILFTKWPIIIVNIAMSLKLSRFF